MEYGSLATKIKELLHKYRYGILVLAIGIALMLVPTNETEERIKSTDTEIVTQISVEEKLSEILSLVDGAGQTQVLLTILSGEETIYQVDEQENINAESSDTKVTTITITNKEKNETGLVRQVIPASYLGAIVVCRGADNPSVKLAIVEAVSRVTGLGADRISVLKMK